MSKASEMEEKLTAEDLRRMFWYDAETGKLYRRISTNNRVKAGDEAGNVNGQGYRQVRVNNVTLQVHRVIWCLQTGAWPQDHLDHINGVRTDNRLENLREVTNAENNRNRGRPSNNTSGAAGVHWHKQRRKWQARIHFNGRTHHLGYYTDLECAKAARRGGEDRFGFSENHGRAA